MTTLQRLERLATLHKTVEFLEGWQEQTKRESLVDTFFSLIAQEKKTTAKVVFEKIKQKSEASQWSNGYINALEGMMSVSIVKNEKNILINQIKAEKSNELKEIFLRHSNNKLHNDFDRGFFAAWVEYMQVIKRLAKLK